MTKKKVQQKKGSFWGGKKAHQLEKEKEICLRVMEKSKKFV